MPAKSRHHRDYGLLGAEASHAVDTGLAGASWRLSPVDRDDLLAGDLPQPYPNLRSAYRDIIPALRRQRNEPGFWLAPDLPA